MLFDFRCWLCGYTVADIARGLLNRRRPCVRVECSSCHGSFISTDRFIIARVDEIMRADPKRVRTQEFEIPI